MSCLLAFTCWFHFFFFKILLNNFIYIYFSYRLFLMKYKNLHLLFLFMTNKLETFIRFGLLTTILLLKIQLFHFHFTAAFCRMLHKDIQVLLTLKIYIKSVFLVNNCDQNINDILKIHFYAKV